MPKSLADFIEGVSNGTIQINKQQLVDLINNANQPPAADRPAKINQARALQSALHDDYDVDLLFRDCQLIISLLDNNKLLMRVTHPDPPQAEMTY
jgi:hypothetical protein